MGFHTFVNSCNSTVNYCKSASYLLAGQHDSIIQSGKARQMNETEPVRFCMASHGTLILSHSPFPPQSWEW